MSNDALKYSLRETYNKYAHVKEKNEMQPWKILPRETFLNLLSAENKKLLLDIGAGVGRDSRFFMDNGLDVTAFCFKKF